MTDPAIQDIEFERRTRRTFDAHHREQASQEGIYRRLRSLISTDYFQVPADFFVGKTVLDAGCGSNANASYALLELGAKRVVSMDMGDAWMDCARGMLRPFAERSILVPGSVLELPFATGEFDFVHCAGVLHHSSDPQRGFGELARVTRPGGLTFITIMANGDGVAYQWVNQLRDRYSADAEFRAVIDGLNADQVQKFFSWILGTMNEEEGVSHRDREFLSSLVDDDLILTVKDRLQAPTYWGFNFSEAQLRGWFEARGYKDVRRLTRYTKHFANGRRFLAPLYYHYDHPVARFFLGEGYVQLLGKKPEVRRVEAAGGVVINENGQLLVVNQCNTSWSLPKGHVSPGETHLDAAIREIQEESGISEVQKVAELGSYERYALAADGREDPSELKRITFYLFRAKSQVLRPQDRQNPEACWASPEQALALLTHAKDRAFLASVLQTIREAITH